MQETAEDRIMSCLEMQLFQYPSLVGDSFVFGTCTFKGGQVGIWAPAHWGLGEIDGLLVPPGKASNLLTDHLITG